MVQKIFIVNLSRLPYADEFTADRVAEDIADLYGASEDELDVKEAQTIG